MVLESRLIQDWTKTTGGGYSFIRPSSDGTANESIDIDANRGRILRLGGRTWAWNNPNCILYWVDWD